jgi:hypothetical protein
MAYLNGRFLERRAESYRTKGFADHFRDRSECAIMASKCTRRSGPESNWGVTHGSLYFCSRGDDDHYFGRTVTKPVFFILPVLALLLELNAYRTVGI